MKQMLKMTCVKHARGIKLLNMPTSMMLVSAWYEEKYAVEKAITIAERLRHTNFKAPNSWLYRSLHDKQHKAEKNL